MKLNMLPAAPGRDKVNRGLVDAELSGNGLLRPASGQQHSDFSHLLCRQLRGVDALAARFHKQAGCDRVLKIFGHRNPFQIFDSVVVFVAIFMVDGHTGRGPWQKRLSDQTMNAPGGSNRTGHKGHLAVALTIAMQLADAVISFLRPRYSAEGRNGVITTKSWDCFPALFHDLAIAEGWYGGKR